MRLSLLSVFIYGLVIAGWFSNLACTSKTLPQYATLQGLRVVTLTLDQPEINFDTGNPFPNTAPVLQFTPVISDLYGGGRSLSYRISLCLDPGVGLGAVPTCTGNPTRYDAASGTVTLPSGDYKSPNYTGALAPIPLDLSLIPAPTKSIYAARFANLSAVQRYNGYAILIFFELYPSGDESQKITTFKRLVLSDSTKPVKNLNPTGLDFKVSGVSLPPLPAVEALIDATVNAASFETYSKMNADGSIQTGTETIETTWFLSGPEDIACSREKACTPDGLLLLTRTLTAEPNRFTPPSVAVPASRGRILIGVARDDRGGNTVTRICDGPAGLCPP